MPRMDTVGKPPITGESCPASFFTEREYEGPCYRIQKWYTSAPAPAVPKAVSEATGLETTP
jgi:hypothetical protein